MERLHAVLLDAFKGKNEAEFRQNYSENTRGWNAVRYEDCALDFVPVTEREYLVVDRSEDRLCGTYTVSPYAEDERTEKTITSLLIADEWDVRKALPVILEKRWTNVYFLLNEAAPKFASFFKLKGFLASLPPNVKFFATTEEMRRYFLETPGAYLPRKIVAPEAGKYEGLIEELHEARIRSGVRSDHVLLSVCVPSLNRGGRALEAVRAALNNRYDAEIEVILVNSGSTIGTEEYQEIGCIVDSRLRYYEYAVNSGFDINFCNTLKKASGHFALILSDEDPLISENLDQVFRYLMNHYDLGINKFYTHKNQPSKLDTGIIPKGLEGLKWTHVYTMHLSGICYNMDIIKEQGIFEQMEKYKEEYPLFAQVLISALIAAKHDVSLNEIKAWIWGKNAETGGLRGEGVVISATGIATFDKPEGSGIMMKQWIRFAKDFLNEQELKEFIDFAVNRILSDRSIVAKQMGLAYEDAIGSWLNLWQTIYAAWREISKELKLENDAELNAQIDRSFFYWLICKRLQKYHAPEENLLPCLQAQVAKYYYDKGTPIEEIDFQGIEKDLEGWVQDFLSKRS